MFDHEQTPNDAFTPLSFKLYAEYYLIPWIAIHLIAEDLECSLETAYEEMIASGINSMSSHVWFTLMPCSFLVLTIGRYFATNGRSLQSSLDRTMIVMIRSSQIWCVVLSFLVCALNYFI